MLFWGVFGALVLRAGFIFAGVALITRFEWMLFVFGALPAVHGGQAAVLTATTASTRRRAGSCGVVHRVRADHRRAARAEAVRAHRRPRLATPLFAVLLLVESTDVLFAVDSVPAVLAVSNEQFIVFTSNAFAIMGLRSLYFLLADMRARFSYLQQGLAIILAFVGVEDDHQPLVPHPDAGLAARDRAGADRLGGVLAAAHAASSTRSTVVGELSAFRRRLTPLR